MVFAVQLEYHANGCEDGLAAGGAAKVPICWPGLHPPAKSVSKKKRILLCVGELESLTHEIGR